MLGTFYLSLSSELRSDFPPELLEVLNLKFNRALNDRTIAKRMGVSDRTIRNYWLRIQDALNITNDPDKDIKVQIELKARKLGLIE